MTLDKINDKIDVVDGKIGDVMETQAQILGLLLDNKFTGEPGLGQRVRTIEAEVAELKSKAQKKKGVYISFAYLGYAAKFLVAAGKALIVWK